MHERISDRITEQLIEPQIGADDFKLNLLVDRSGCGPSGTGRALQDRSQRNHSQSNHFVLQLQKRAPNLLSPGLKLRLLFRWEAGLSTVERRSCEPREFVGRGE